MRPRTQWTLELLFLALKALAVMFILTIVVALAWLKWTGLLDGYSGPDCRHLKRIMDDEDVQNELVQWVDNDLERALQDWTNNGPYFGSATGGSPGTPYFKEHNFDLTLLGFTPESQFNWPKIRLVTWNPLTPHYPQSSVDPDEGIEFLMSVTHSVSFTEVSRVALLVRMRSAESFGVNVEHLRKVHGRLAVYCEPRD